MSIIFDAKITMGNHAFVQNDGDYRHELAKCLREVAERMDGEEIVGRDVSHVGPDGMEIVSETTGFIKDTNGNTCGKWHIKEVDGKTRITSN